MPWWITFKDGSAGCINSGAEGEAIAKAERIVAMPVESCKPLPYSAYRQILDKGEPRAMDFCMSPERCAGWLSCPRPYSCTE